MASENTKFLDLDAVDVGPEVVIKLQGVEHKLKPISVEDFIVNTKALQSLGAEADFEAEVGMVVDMLTRAFPTMTTDMLKKLPMAALNKMLDFANANNGAAAVKEEAKAEAAANPQPAVE